MLVVVALAMFVPPRYWVSVVLPSARYRSISALTRSAWVIGPIVSYAFELDCRHARQGLREEAGHPLDEAGESEPVMTSTGTSSAAKADSGVGSRNTASHSAFTVLIAVASPSRLGSGMAAHVPAPIQ